MEIFERISILKKSNQTFVVATVVKSTGSVPGKTGFKIIIESNGKTSGTVGGGAIEKKVIEDGQKMLTGKEHQLKEYVLSKNANTAKSDVAVVPMMCEGKVWIYYEYHGEMPVIYVFGGGHVSQALLYHLRPLGYYSILIDNRKEFAEGEKSHLASEAVFSEYGDFVKKFKPTQNSFFVILTHGHKHDYECLRGLKKRKIITPYIGVIASKAKAKELKNSLKNELGNSVDLSNVYSPIGLEIGGTTADEIAISICSEIQAIRYKKKK